jgi:hypothetical protein
LISIKRLYGRFLFGIIFNRFLIKSVLMKQDNPGEANKDIDVTRSEHQQAQQEAGASPTGDEKRMEGAKGKGNPEHQHGSHAEGQYPKQSDNPTMRPSGADNE